MVVVGAGGRLGRRVVEWLEAAPDLCVAHALGRDDDLGAGLAARLAERPAALAFEATVAGLGATHAQALLALGLRPVVATSGVAPEEVAELDTRARAAGLGGLVVPNLSLGMCLLQRLAVEAARHVGRVAIVERHHEGKRDAPSGTALDTARRLEAAGAAPVAIHSVRLPGLYAHQEVQFGAPGETLTLRHDMHDPGAFRPGVLAALRFARTADGVALGLAAALAGEQEA